jgi:hypothetical protein
MAGQRNMMVGVGEDVDPKDPFQRFLDRGVNELLGDEPLLPNTRKDLLTALKNVSEDNTCGPNEIVLLQDAPGFVIAKTAGQLAAVEVSDGGSQLIFGPERIFQVGVGAHFGAIGSLVKPAMHSCALQNVGTSDIDSKLIRVSFEDVLLTVDGTGALLRRIRLGANGRVSSWYADVNKDMAKFGQREVTIPSVADADAFVHMLGNDGWITAPSPLNEARFVQGSFVLNGPGGFSVRGENAVIGLSHLNPSMANRGWICVLGDGARSHVITRNALLEQEDLSAAVLENQLLGIGASYSVLAGLQAQRPSVSRAANASKLKSGNGGFWGRIVRAFEF